MLASRGCDFVDISGGTAANKSEPRARTAAAQSNAGAIRRHLQLHAPSCPTVVMTVGGIREPRQAEVILQDGEADLIGIGSQFL
jgi:2,4-dienoyl-CoA reductase-like NADH-dependent reductase (Old Yellow Enzyme family)